MKKAAGAPPKTADGEATPGRSPGRFGPWRTFTPEELHRYRALPAETKLAWLHAIWRFNVDFLPERARRHHERFRRGD